MIKNILMGIVNFFKILFVDKEYNADPPKPPVIYIPKKPRLTLSIDTSTSRKWLGVVWHHSATRDDLVHKDVDAIIVYHKSFRIDFNAVAEPQKVQQPGIKYIKYKNGEWYKQLEYDNYFSELKKKEANLTDKRYFEPAWMDVGYHGLIESAEDKMVFRWGRPLSMIGAHAGYKEFNENYIGFCAIGNYDKFPVLPDVWTFALMVTRTFMDTFSIPAVNVLGHREVYDKMGVPRQKMCPGINWDMDKFREGL
jgi:hypothetical protein